MQIEPPIKTNNKHVLIIIIGTPLCLLYEFDSHFFKDKVTFIQKKEENKVNSKPQIMEKRW